MLEHKRQFPKCSQTVKPFIKWFALTLLLQKPLYAHTAPVPLSDAVDPSWTIHRKWNENHSQLLSIRYYGKNGEKEGIHTGYYNSGAKRFQYHFHNGRCVGYQWDWYENGQVRSLKLYKNGKMVSHKIWRSNGKIYRNRPESSDFLSQVQSKT